MSLTTPGGDSGIEIYDPIKEGAGGRVGKDISSIGDIISPALNYIFAFASIILFFLIIGGGLTLLMSAGDQEKVKKGQGMITSGLTGFIIIFISYWLIQAIQIIFNLKLGF